MGTTVFSLLFRSGTHGIRTRNMGVVWHVVCQLSHVHVRCELLGTSCSGMHILICWFLDDPLIQNTSLFYWFHSLYISIIIFSYSLNDSTFIPLFNAQHILSTHVHAFFLLFSFFKHLGREKFKIIITFTHKHNYWEMSDVMRNGSCIEESAASHQSRDQHRSAYRIIWWGVQPLLTRLRKQ